MSPRIKLFGVVCLELEINPYISAEDHLRHIRNMLDTSEQALIDTINMERRRDKGAQDAFKEGIIEQNSFVQHSDGDARGQAAEASGSHRDEEGRS